MVYFFNLAKIDIFYGYTKYIAGKLLTIATKKSTPNRVLFIDYTSTLLLQEASLEHDAAAINFAIYLLGVLREADALNLCATLDDHR